uniref:Hsp90 co-chaperone Cdc37-like 1 n=1 Tax=Poecilia reticulata TaxID=8081 RepID=A0A3P9NQQ2_POERE
MHSPSSHLCDCSMASLCQSQQRCVKASIVSSWRLAEAQDQMCSLGVHSSESLEQERARTLVCPTELTNTEEEWRRKESMLAGPEPSRSPVLGATGSWDVFDKSIINLHNQPVEMDQDTCKTFLQKYEQELRHFGMLRRWDDSQRFLSHMPQLICEETANFLVLWCIRLQQEGKEALMEQVAHQAVVMQFILEMASNSQQDPRGCFRQFFHKAKVHYRQFIYCIMYLYLLSLYRNYDPRLYKQIFYMLSLYFPSYMYLIGINTMLFWIIFSFSFFCLNLTYKEQVK